MKTCANVNVMFADLPFLDRFGAARALGFDGVEVPFPYDHAVPDILTALATHELKMVMIAGPPPNYTGAERGFAAVPGAEDRFRRDFKRTMRYAKALGADHVHIMSGVIRGPEARETLIENLAWALAEAPEQSLTLEPMCQEDAPGYYLNNLFKASDIISEIGHPILGLQFDTHHVQQMHGDVLSAFSEVSDQVSHIQIAQSPLRVAPHKQGEIDIAKFLKDVRASGYKGWIAGEYASDGVDPAHAFWVG